MRVKGLVTIITPFKNTSAYLRATLDSILKQTYSHWELIAVNDHSSDDSLQIVLDYAKSDTRIQVHNNRGKGIISALQHAYSLAKGEFVTRMDSDDIMVPHKLDTMVCDLKRYGKGHLALGLVKYFSDEFQIGDGYLGYQNWLNKLTKEGSNYTEIYKECVIASPCWMAYRDDFDKCGGFSREVYPEDYDLTFRFYESGLKCIPSNEVLHLWRDYSSRTSRTHVNYANNTFIELKTDYFLKLHYKNEHPLVLWGAGNKGKTIAKKFIDNNIPFHWVCDNPQKIGKHIYGKEMLAFQMIDSFENAQNIITVANKKAQEEIRGFFKTRKKQPFTDYFFFC